MIKKSVTVREDQARYISHSSLNFSGWARGKLELWLHDETKDLPTDRTLRDGPMEQKHVLVKQGVANAINSTGANLSHFIQDRLDERMERERKRRS